MSESPGIEQDIINHLHDYKADRERLERLLDGRMKNDDLMNSIIDIARAGVGKGTI